jgi:hypothetical protein
MSKLELQKEIDDLITPLLGCLKQFQDSIFAIYNSQEVILDTSEIFQLINIQQLVLPFFLIKRNSKRKLRFTAFKYFIS